MKILRWMAGRRLLIGMVLGIALTFAAGALINRTTLADRLARPLMLPDTDGPGDVIVVLTAGMTARCAPNLQGLRRVLLAAQLFEQGRAPMVLISGSGGQRGPADCTVAGEMQNLLVRLGVPADRIRLEPTSGSTWQNAERADAVLTVLGARRIVLVTDRPHMRRADACFRRFGYGIERAGVAVYLGHRDNIELLAQTVREYAALAAYRLRGYMSDEPAASTLVTAVDPPDITPDVTAREEPGADRDATGPVVILGASYARGWNPTVKGLEFVNQGVDGQQSFELLARFDQAVAGRDAGAVIIWGFINDIYRASRSEVQGTLARVRDSYTAMLQRAGQAGVTPILATETTMGLRAGAMESLMALVGTVLNRPGYADYVNRHVMDTNEWLRETARRRGLLLLDFERALSGGAGRRRREFTAPDGSHLNPAAYAALDQYAAPLLRQHLPAPR